MTAEVGTTAPAFTLDTDAGGKLSPGELAGNPIVLLADTEHEVAGAYGVWKQESMFGKSHPGVERTTFIIDENGRVANVFAKANPNAHAEAVAEALQTEAGVRTQEAAFR